MKNIEQKDMYALITNRLISELEKGNIAWRKTWNAYGIAKNYATGKAYKGINFLMMNFFSPYPIPYFMSFKQAKDLGGNIKKGAKAEQVIYFSTYFKDGDNNSISAEQATERKKTGEKVKVLKFLRYYSVFNVANIEGIDFNFEEMPLKPHEKIEKCEQILGNYPNAPRYEFKDLQSAFYSPTFDYINMPPLEQHDTPEDYYCTFFHELIHSTGHAKRLNRAEIVETNKFGSEPYSIEELTAELGASFLCHIAQIENTALIENSAAYIKGWLKQLKNDNQFIFKASAEAQKAVDYIYNFDDTEQAEEKDYFALAA